MECIGPGKDSVTEEDDAHVGQPRNDWYKARRFGRQLSLQSANKKVQASWLDDGRFWHIKSSDNQSGPWIQFVKRHAPRKRQSVSISILQVPLHTNLCLVCRNGQIINNEGKASRKTVGNPQQVFLQPFLSLEGIVILRVLVRAVLGEAFHRSRHISLVPRLEVALNGCCGVGGGRGGLFGVSHSCSINNLARLIQECKSSIAGLGLGFRNVQYRRNFIRSHVHRVERTPPLIFGCLPISLGMPLRANGCPIC